MSETGAIKETTAVEKIAIPVSELTESEAVAFHVLEEVCTESMLDIRPVVRSVQPPYIEIELVGPDALISFGKNGKHLDALQFLCNTIISRKAPDDAEYDKAEHGVADDLVPAASRAAGPPGDGDEQHQAPVEHPHREVPYRDGLAHCSGGRPS